MCRERLVLSAWILFAVALLAATYRQVGPIFTLGLVTWVRSNDSLQAATRPIAHLLQGSTRLFPAAWPEALARNSAALLGVAAVLLAAYAYGAMVLRLARLRLDSTIEVFLFRFAFGLGVLAYLSLGLALLGLYRRAIVVPWVVALPAAATLAWLLAVARRASQTPSRQPVHTVLAASLRRDAFWSLPLAVAGLVALVGALAPEIEYDSLWYHLWLPVKWMESGRPVDLVNEYISLYPLTWELVYGAAQATGGPVAAKLLHWACLPLTGLLIYRFARRFFPQAPAGLAVALFVTVPTILWEATTAYNDLALAFFATLALYACFCYLDTRRQTWLVLGGLALGLALATKHLAFFGLILISVGLAALLWGDERNLRKAFGPVLLLAGISLLVPLPWYLRSWAASGNPFFPDLYSVFGAYPPERWSDLTERGLTSFKNHFGDPRTPLNLLKLPWNMTVHAARYGGSLGPVLLLLLPGLLLPRQPLDSRIRSPARLLLLYVAGYLALWASPLSSFQLRFVLPLTPALALLGAEAFGRLGNALASWNLRGWMVKAFLAGLLLLNLPPFLSLHEADRAGDLGWLTHVLHRVPLGVALGYETEAGYLSRQVPSFRAWQYINTHLPIDARILTFSGGDHLYSVRERLWSDATAARPAVWGAPRGAEAQALAALRRLGITHLLVDRRQAATISPWTIAILEPDALAKYFRLEYEDDYFAVYEFRIHQ